MEKKNNKRNEHCENKRTQIGEHDPAAPSSAGGAGKSLSRISGRLPLSHALGRTHSPRHMGARKRKEYQTSFDLVADEYVRRIFDELQHKPLDQQLLDRFAASVREVGPACDMGCGPGHVARYLHERGVQVCGIDLSPAMVERARGLTPGVEFRQGDMTALDAPGAAWARRKPKPIELIR